MAIDDHNIVAPSRHVLVYFNYPKGVDPVAEAGDLADAIREIPRLIRTAQQWRLSGTDVVEVAWKFGGALGVLSRDGTFEDLIARYRELIANGD